MEAFHNYQITGAWIVFLLVYGVLVLGHLPFFRLDRTGAALHIPYKTFVLTLMSVSIGGLLILGIHLGRFFVEATPLLSLRASFLSINLRYSHPVHLSPL